MGCISQGRPKGVTEEFRLTPVVAGLKKYLKCTVAKADDCIGEDVRAPFPLRVACRTPLRRTAVPRMNDVREVVSNAAAFGLAVSTTSDAHVGWLHWLVDEIVMAVFANRSPPRAG